MTEILLVILILLLLGVLIFLIYNQRSKKQDDGALTLLQSQLNQLSSQQNEKLDRTIKELQDRLNEQNKTLNEQLNRSNTDLHKQLSMSQQAIKNTAESTGKIVRQVTEKLTTLEKTNTQVMDFAKQLESLEKILKNPKQRGVLGEYFLETTLKNVLPPESFQMQYKFKNGELVDAVVFVKDKIVPIDSKFSLENYNRILQAETEVEKEKLEKQFKQDLKTRIEETSKYIRPDEGTMDFAFMFIPSEGLYYDLLINKIGALQINTRDLISYAFSEKNVIIVSPTSFLAYLQTVLQGLRALKIEESAKEIRSSVGKLAQHLKAYEDNFGKLGRNLQTTVNFYNKSHKELGKIDKDIVKITGEKLELSSEELQTVVDTKE